MYRWVGGGGWWLLKRGELRVGWRGGGVILNGQVQVFLRRGGGEGGRRVVQGNRRSKEFIYNLVPEKKNNRIAKLSKDIGLY